MKIKYSLPKLKMTIFQQLLIGIIAMLILNAIIAFVGIFSVNELENTAKVMLSESKSYNNLQNLKSNFHQLQMPANDYLIHGNKVELTNFEQLDSLAIEQIKKCKVFTGVHFEQKFMNGLENSLYEVESFSKNIFKLKNPIGNPEGAIMMEKMDDITNKVTKNIDSLLVISAQEMDYHINTNQATNIRATRVIIFVGLFIMICLVVGGFFYVQAITKPLENLALTAKKISSGDLSSKADINSRTRDEIDDFAKLFNNMIDVLAETTVSREYFNNILNRMADTLIITDINGKIMIANQAAIDLLEYKKDELIGQSIEMILSSKSEKEFSDGADKSIESEEESVQNIYNTYYSKSNKAIPVSFSKSFMYDDKNKMKGILYIAFHNTEEHLEEQIPLEEFSGNERNIKITGDIPLTNRELEIIKLIIEGISNREIADKLFISVRTVETHRKNIMQKLHTKNIIALVHYAIHNKII